MTRRGRALTRAAESPDIRLQYPASHPGYRRRSHGGRARHRAPWSSPRTILSARVTPALPFAPNRRGWAARRRLSRPAPPPSARPARIGRHRVFRAKHGRNVIRLLHIVPPQTFGRGCVSAVRTIIQTSLSAQRGLQILWSPEGQFVVSPDNGHATWHEQVGAGHSVGSGARSSSREDFLTRPRRMNSLRAWFMPRRRRCP